jgi:quercetin dioxygenase-like cupin family protein
MKMFRFDAEVGKEIQAFGSNGFTMSRIVRTSGEVHVGAMHLLPGGVIGWHQATTEQLLLVVSGIGFVRSGDKESGKDGAEWIAIHAGQAAFWSAGEWHETLTETGLTGIVVENPDMLPQAVLA